MTAEAQLLPLATRPLVLAAHGTKDPRGQQVIHDLARAVAAELGEVELTVGWVDVIEPRLGDVTPPGAVIVPVFLGTGYHVKVDVADVASRVHGVTATRPLGPVPEVLAAVVDRLGELGGAPDAVVPDAVVLGAAGSSDALSRAESAGAAALLEPMLGVPVREGYLSAASPTVAEAVATLRAEGHERVVIASYLLAPGYFNDQLHRAGADAVSEPIGAHPRVVSLVAGRYRDVTG